MRIFIVFLLAASVFAGAAEPEIIQGRALWIKDGDTVVLRHGDSATDIRLWGIDAPETDQPGGYEATMLLIKLVGRKWVSVEIKDRDKWGRSVGIITQAGRNINLIMIQRGRAWWYRHYAPDWIEAKDAEAAARADKIGLWSRPDPVPPWDFRQKKKGK